ncbi:GyrI-like domain-containing protein [Hydrogenoanaerobacterium sp.]|uniref:GyrI-like domain-containing protein n=1 Tax=Hydrogenoanaerobacterium sp. TaxID=2953763 RepID=UPI00289EE31B|nr:GyrI-like domain-containing protein [Hydrogenoanaerobacterium sp.]
MNGKLDFKKQEKALYLPRGTPELVEVPPMQYLMLDGCGDPNGEQYKNAVEVLYAIAYTIKMSKEHPQGWLDYTVPPLEGLWDCGCDGFELEKRQQWAWTSMIRQPDFVTQNVLRKAKETLAVKKPQLDTSGVRLSAYEEGLCVQLMHIGPYSTEQESIDKIAQFVAQNNLTDECGNDRRHHEIYLSDPRKAAPENLKTILRHPVAHK